MRIETYLWHPAGGARQYEAAGSRTSFKQKRNPDRAHLFHAPPPASDALKLMLDALTDEQKARWLC